MQFLRALAELRTPLGDTLVSLVTRLGEETVLMVVALVLYWCVDKKKGCYLLLVGLCGTLVNQALKITFRVPRPWVLDPDFEIVEAAREEATGFSFPSGHTQSAAGTFGSLARMEKRGWLRGLWILIAVLVGFSRLYLGVHTPLDVAVSLLVATALVLGLYPLAERASRRPGAMLKLWAFWLIPAMLFVVYAHVLRGAAVGEEALNLTSAVKNSWTLLGALGGMVLSLYADEHYLHFETKAVWWAQLLKVALGLGLMLAIKSLLKAPLVAIFGANSIGDGIRYGLMVIAAGVFWPMTFRFFGALGRKKD